MQDLNAMTLLFSYTGITPRIRMQKHLILMVRPLMSVFLHSDHWCNFSESDGSRLHTSPFCIRGRVCKYTFFRKFMYYLMKRQVNECGFSSTTSQSNCNIAHPLGDVYQSIFPQTFANFSTNKMKSFTETMTMKQAKFYVGLRSYLFFHKMNISILSLDMEVFPTPTRLANSKFIEQHISKS